MHRGFTLIEVSIVIVVIGLLVGAVIVGSDLITAAGLRATIKQVEKYNTAVYTFRNKYGGLPGDLFPSQASAFGFFALDDGLEVPNSNGQIDLLTAANPNRAFSGEAPVFWRHLSEAGLINGSFGIAGTSDIDTDGTLSGIVVQIDQSIPPARIGRGNFITAYSSGGANYYEINAITRISAQGVYTVPQPGLLPLEAYSIDLKIDDGGPYSGLVVARGRINLNGELNQLPDVVAPPGVVGCTDGTAYVTSYTEPICALRIELGKH